MRFIIDQILLYFTKWINDVRLNSGSINGIFFTAAKGRIPIVVTLNLMQMALDATGTGFTIQFWTDRETLNSVISECLIEAGVMIRDYREVMGLLAETIHEFVSKGHSGDLCAYTIASDILRIAIAGSLPDDHLFMPIVTISHFHI